MKKLTLILIATLALSATAMAADIAISTSANWWTQSAADRETEVIANSVTDADVQLFTASDETALANWVIAHTGDGMSDLLMLCGKLPNSIYPAGNAEPDGSIIEEFLDDGNCIINTGDWMFYVCDQGNNGDQGMVNIMDLSTMTSRWDDNVPVTATAEAAMYTPSLVNFTTDRAMHMDLLDNGWVAELALALAADGVRADPGVVYNTETGGRIGIFYEVASEDNLPRGVVISEWINNWYLPTVGDPEQASDPMPTDDEADVLRTATLSWTPGESATTHDVYMGTVFDDVNDATRTNTMGVLVSQGQSGTTYDPTGVLEFGQVYYWRVDEVQTTGTITKGKVWTFTAESEVYPIQNITVTTNTTSSSANQGPQKLVDGSGLNAADQHSANTDHMWAGTPNPSEPSYLQFNFDGVYKLSEMMVWNYNMQFEAFLGYGIKNITLEYSQDGTDWTMLGDFELAQGTGSATYAANSIVPLDGVAAKHLRMTINSNFSNTTSVYGCSEIRILSVPVQASGPQPADGATNVAIDTTLTWRHGREAVSHEVYLGTDPDALTMAGTSTQSSFGPTLDLESTYYWQVVEVNNAEAISSWAGSVWSFTTEEYIEVDTFESYNDDIEAGGTIWQTWIDGLDDSTNGGAVVGYGQSPFAEQDVVRSGRQAMPLFFDNGSASAISEADRTLTPAQDWTAHGIKTLTLWFHGAGDNTGKLYVKINNTKVSYNGSPIDISTAQWQPWNIDLTTVSGTNNVRTLTVGVEGTGSGVVYIDDIRLYGKLPQTLTPVEPGTTNLVAYYPLNGNANDASGHGYNGTGNGGFLYVAGVDGQALDVDGASGYISVTNATNWPAGAAPRTMSAWLLTRSIDSGYRFAVAYGSPATGQAMFVGINGTMLASGAYGDDVNLNNFWTTNEWIHVALTYDGTTARLYANGLEVNSAAKTWNLVLNRARIGQQVNDASEFWDGTIDEVYIFNAALSAEEIAGLAGKTAPVNLPF